MSSSVRVDDDTKERLNQLASDEDRPMSRIVANALDVYEQQKLARVAVRPDRAAVKETLAAPKTSAGLTAAPAGDCPHPDDQRKVRSWGAVCGACGTVLR